MKAFREVELRALQGMNAAQKIAAMHALWRTAWILKEASLRSRNPGWTELELHARVRDAMAREPS